MHRLSHCLNNKTQGGQQSGYGHDPHANNGATLDSSSKRFLWGGRWVVVVSLKSCPVVFASPITNKPCSQCGARLSHKVQTNPTAARLNQTHNRTTVFSCEENITYRVHNSCHPGLCIRTSVHGCQFCLVEPKWRENHLFSHQTDLRQTVTFTCVFLKGARSKPIRAHVHVEGFFFLPFYPC